MRAAEGARTSLDLIDRRAPDKLAPVRSRRVAILQEEKSPLATENVIALDLMIIGVDHDTGLRKGKTMIQELKDGSFGEEVLKSPVPYLVDFWATWCAPCTMIAATVEAVADKYSERLKAGRLNVDDNPRAATNYGVSSIPSIMIFKNGEVVDRLVGVQPKTRLQQALDQVK